MSGAGPWEAKFGGPWDGRKKKNLYSVRQPTFSSSQICKEVQKPYGGKGPGWLSFFESMPKIFILNYIVFVFIIIILFLGVEVALAYHEVIIKLKMNHLWLYTLHDISHSMPQRLQNVIKNKWGMPVTEVLNTCTRKSNKHLLEFSCKNKVLIKSFSLWN